MANNTQRITSEGFDRFNSLRAMVGGCGIGLRFGNMKLLGHTDSKSKITSVGVPAHSKPFLLVGLLYLK